MKSVVAFTNGTGGKIILGIADETRKIAGFDKEDIFQKMDAYCRKDFRRKTATVLYQGSWQRGRV